jgi:signal transduction histidine kinase
LNATTDRPSGLGTFKAFFRSQLEGPWQEELRAAQRETFLARTLVLVWIAWAGMPTTCLAYVWFLARDRMREATWMAGIACAAVALIYLLVKKGAFNKYYQLSMLLMVGCVFGPLASGIIEITRGSSGDFFFAFFMIYFSFTALYPAEIEWVLGTSAVVISSLILSRLGRPEGIVFDGPLVSSLIYLGEMTFMATVMNRVVYQLFFDEKRARLELAKANEGLRELDKAKSSFFHNISHEIRTPLTLILTPLTHILRTRKDELPPELVQKLEGIRGNANRLLKMVNSLLDFARLEAGQAKVTVTDIALDDLVRYVAGLFSGTAENKNITLATEIDAPKLRVRADVDKLEKILVNLVGNALKFTPPGGTITLACKRDGDRYELSVTDTGVGIPKAHLSAIFQRFVQLENSKQASVRGTGIGLSMVQEYSKLLGGDVRVESEEGQGSTFRVTLPIKGPGDIEETTDKADSFNPPPREDAELAIADVVVERRSNLRVIDKAGPGKPRVLVVDDNPALVSLVSSILESEYNLFLAGNGEEALARLRSDHVDLVVSDVMMPGVTGLQLVEHIRKDEKLSHLPVILLTARGGTSAKVEGLEIGADDYIGKPFDPEELKARVRSLFELRRTTRNLTEKTRDLEAALKKLGDEELKVIESEKLRTLGELAAGMFHELHNYMNIVCNGALPLKDMIFELEKTLSEKQITVPDVDPNDLIELTETVIEAATAARGVTAELKGYAYQENGPGKFVDINAIVQSTIRMFPKRSEAAKLVFQPSNDAVVVQCVPTRLTQVFTNLVKNAFEAMSWKGTVTIATRREGGSVIATVTDTGPGIPESQRGKLFQPFHTTKKQGEGLGLGLSLSQKVVHDLGGELRIDPNYRDGARFVITLPAQGASTTVEIAGGNDSNNRAAGSAVTAA